jgi:hypothetical protein
MPLVDAETKKVIIQKTWCHGQAICPVYGIVILWWYVDSGFQPKSLIFPGLFLPYWCYLSYRSIFVNFDYRTIIIGGLLAEVSHAIVFSVALQHLEKTMHMIIFIASILLFIETAAFLGVVTAFRPRDRPDDNNTASSEESSNSHIIDGPVSYQSESLLV